MSGYIPHEDLDVQHSVFTNMHRNPVGSSFYTSQFPLKI